MITYDIARVDYKDIRLIMVPVNASLENRTRTDQRSFVTRVEASVREVGFDGVVVPVWRGYTGRMKFLAPESLQDLLREMEWSFVAKHINGKITLA